jgi:hypothetical protein
MPINPIDMQVSIPRSGEVNKIQRTGQDQQQINQQAMDQSVKLSLTAQEQTVQKSFEADRQELKNDDRSKKRKKKQDEGSRQKDKEPSKDQPGGLDIRI